MSTELKWCYVEWQVGALASRKREGLTVYVPLPDDVPLTPLVARIAAYLALGRWHDCWVWSWDTHGYALYPKTERKITREAEYTETLEEVEA